MSEDKIHNQKIKKLFKMNNYNYLYFTIKSLYTLHFFKTPHHIYQLYNQ